MQRYAIALLGFADQAVRRRGGLRQTAATVVKGIGGDRRCPKPARRAVAVVKMFQACCPVEHTEEVLGLQEDILVALAAALFMKCFYHAGRR